MIYDLLRAINSAAHTFGYKPFDTKITAVDNLIVATLTNGEAWHNYHHTFPQVWHSVHRSVTTTANVSSFHTHFSPADPPETE